MSERRARRRRLIPALERLVRDQAGTPEGENARKRLQELRRAERQDSERQVEEEDRRRRETPPPPDEPQEFIIRAGGYVHTVRRRPRESRDLFMARVVAETRLLNEFARGWPLYGAGSAGQAEWDRLIREAHKAAAEDLSAEELRRRADRNFNDTLRASGAWANPSEDLDDEDLDDEDLDDDQVLEACDDLQQRTEALAAEVERLQRRRRGW